MTTKQVEPVEQNEPTEKKRKKRDKSDLAFHPLAWLKIKYMLQKTDNEVSFMGMSAPDDPLYIVDVFMPPQEGSGARTDFLEGAFSDLSNRLLNHYFTEQDIDEGRALPERWSRVWIHTHPFDCAKPSRPDWETFDEAFENQGWAVMVIFAAEGHDVTANLRVHHTIPEGHLECAPHTMMATGRLNVKIDWAVLPDEGLPTLDKEALDKEFEDNFHERVYHTYQSSNRAYTFGDSDDQALIEKYKYRGKKARKKDPNHNTQQKQLSQRTHYWDGQKGELVPLTDEEIHAFDPDLIDAKEYQQETESGLWVPVGLPEDAPLRGDIDEGIAAEVINHFNQLDKYKRESVLQYLFDTLYTST